MATLGTIITDTFNRTTGLGSNYTTVGGATWNVTNGNDLVMSGGSTGFGRYARYSNYGSTMLEHFSKTINISSIGTISSTSNGFALGLESTNVFNKQHFRAWFCTNTSANRGKILLYNNLTLKVASAAVTINNNDAVTLTFTRICNKYIASITVNGGAPTTVEYTVSTSSGAESPNNTGQFSIYTLGGTQTVTDWTVTSDAEVGATACFIGNSIISGKQSALNTMRMASLMNYFNSSSYVVQAGGGDTTQSALDAINELTTLNATNYFIMICGNDIEYGVSSGTWQANYGSLVGQLKAIGANVIHVIDAPRNSVDLTPIKTHVDGTYSSDLRVDLLTRMLGTGTGLNSKYNYGDGIHWNNSGHRDAADYTMDSASAYLPTLTQSLDTDTQAFVTANDAVSTWPIGWTRRQMYDDLIVQCKTDMGIDGVTSNWDSLEALWLYVTYEDVTALIDIKGLVTATKAGTTNITWSIDNMYDGNGSGYINTGLNFGNGGSHKFALNDASYGCWLITNQAAAVFESGCLDSLSKGFYFNPRTAGGKISVAMNGNGNSTMVSTDSAGFWVVKKMDSTTVRCYKNGVERTDSPQTVSGSVLNNQNTYAFCSNTNGTAASFTSRNKRLEFYGNSNVDAQKLYDAIRNKFLIPLNITGN